MKTALERKKPEGLAQANGTPPLNDASEYKRKPERRQHDIFVEHTRASVRRGRDGGLVIERRLSILTFLPPAEATWKRQNNRRED